MQDFRKLKVWGKSHKLTLEIYKEKKSFPSEGKYGLISRIRQSSSYVPTNIAEGCGHTSKNEFARYIQIAIVSICETEYLLKLSKDLFCIDNNYNETVEKRKMLMA